MAENKKNESPDVENLEVDVLSDSDLETASGGTNNILSTAKNSCCPTGVSPIDVTE